MSYEVNKMDENIGENTYFLFCLDPLNKRKPDMDYVKEYEEAKANGFNVILFSYEDLIELGKVNISLENATTFP